MRSRRPSSTSLIRTGARGRRKSTCGPSTSNGSARVGAAIGRAIAWVDRPPSRGGLGRAEATRHRLGEVLTATEPAYARWSGNLQDADGPPWLRQVSREEPTLPVDDGDGLWTRFDQDGPRG